MIYPPLSLNHDHVQYLQYTQLPRVSTCGIKGPPQSPCPVKDMQPHLFTCSGRNEMYSFFLIPLPPHFTNLKKSDAIQLCSPYGTKKLYIRGRGVSSSQLCILMSMV
jgi:hypothetical protein